MLIALLGATVALAQVPADNQALLILRILAFDRKLASRAGGTVKIVIISRDGSSESESAQAVIGAALESAASKNTVSGLPVHVVHLSFSTAAKFEADLGRSGATAAYVCPGLGDELDAITRATRAHGVLTFTGSEPFVARGVSVGLVRREAKAGILVNLSASRAESADLDSALLRMAEVIR